MSPSSPVPLSNLRRIVLSILTLFVAVIMGQALVGSLNEPQVASRLELYQTDLLLQATAWEGGDLSPDQVALLRSNLLGEDPLATATATYRQVREQVVDSLASQVSVVEGTSPRRQAASGQQGDLLDVVDLRLGILQAQQGDVAAAVVSWEQVQGRTSRQGDRWRTAATLIALWQGESLPAASESLLQEQLQGWFRTQALDRFYQQTNQPEAVVALQEQAQAQGKTTVLILGVVGVFPAVGSLVGIGILLVVVGQRLWRGQQGWLAQNAQDPWDTPWTGETIWQVMVGGFLFLGQIVIPLVVGTVAGSLGRQGIRGQATYALVYYVLMAAGAIAVLVLSLRPYRPLPEGWFPFNLKGTGWLWGIGGYFAALPLMLSVSLLNQQLWQGQGGSNPLLQLVLEAHDPMALGIFFVTAAIAAPVFEEILFRGFLLPSLTRYLPVGGAIWLSSALFALAHLSLSEVLPLMVLGMVLGLVYTRSRNLWAPILLHSAWNSVTMIGLFLLGSAA